MPVDNFIHRHFCVDTVDKLYTKPWISHDERAVSRFDLDTTLLTTRTPPPITVDSVDNT